MRTECLFLVLFVFFTITSTGPHAEDDKNNLLGVNEHKGGQVANDHLDLSKIANRDAEMILSNKIMEAIHEDYADQIFARCINVISEAPESALAYHIALTTFPLFVEEFVLQYKDNYSWLDCLKIMEQRNSGSKKYATRLLISQAYLTLSNINIAKRISCALEGCSDECIKEYNRKYSDYNHQASLILRPLLKERTSGHFRTISKMLYINLLDRETFLGRLKTGMLLNSVGRVSSEYKFIVQINKIDRKCRRISFFSKKRERLCQRKFDLALEYPIGAIPIWENPVPLMTAFITSQQILFGEQKMKMLQRLAPLLNDQNDLPGCGRQIRVAIYRDMARMHLNESEFVEATRNAHVGASIAIYQDDKDMFRNILRKIEALKHRQTRIKNE